MKLIIAASFTLVTGIAQAATQLEIPVDAKTIPVEQSQQPRWEESRNIPHDKAVALIAAGEKAGGDCHELTAQSTVVCFFQGGRSAGIDWQQLNEDVGIPSELKPGTADAAKAVAYSFLSSRFIEVAPPQIEGDHALVTAMFMGQECTLNMQAIAPTPFNKYGWSIYGEVCGPISAAEQSKWTIDKFGKPRFAQP
jgi:hypothetical protein